MIDPKTCRYTAIRSNTTNHRMPDAVKHGDADAVGHNSGESSRVYLCRMRAVIKTQIIRSF